MTYQKIYQEPYQKIGSEEMIDELNQLLSIPILFGLIFFASNTSEKDRTFLAMACLMLSVFMQNNLPEWAALLHALLGWVFVWAYKGTKEKWFLPVIGIEIAMTAVELFPTVAYKVYSFFPLLSSQLFFSVYALVIGIGVIVSKKLYLRVNRNDREKPVEHEKSYLEGKEHQKMEITKQRSMRLARHLNSVRIIGKLFCSGVSRTCI